MKYRYQFILSILTFCLSVGVLFAQQDIDPTVEVNREYQSKLLQISKSPIGLDVADSLSKLNLKFDYSVFDRPFKDLYEFVPLKSIEIDHDKKVQYPSFYTKLAYSYPVIPYADIVLSPRLGKNFMLIVDAQHRSVWKDKLSNDRMKTNVGLGLGYAFKSAELYGRFSYENRYNQLRENSAHHFNQLGGNLGIRSTSSKDNAVSYRLRLDYNYLDDRASTAFPKPVFDDYSEKEHTIDLSGSLGYSFLKYHNVALDLGTNVAINSSLTPLHFGVFDIAPIYTFSKGRHKLKAGLDLSFEYRSLNENDSETLYSGIYPKVEYSFEAFKNSLWLYARGDGYTELNTISSILEYNPWAFDCVSNYIPSKNILGELGLKGQVGNRFSFDVKGGVSGHQNMLNFIISSNSLRAYYLDRSRAYAEIDLGFSTKSFKIDGGFTYSNFFNEDVYMMPTMKANLSVAYNYKNRFKIKVACDYLSEMYYVIINDFDNHVSVPYSFDLQANISYAFSNSFTLFVQGSNLLNQRIQYAATYLEPGLNIGAGITMKF